jgi:DNA polymerase I-like protein with 3'-5' exonuclease and polymerase domains
MKWRGSILSSEVGKVIPTIHPAAILRDYGDKPIFELDLRRVVVEAKTREIQIPRPRFILAPTKQEVFNWIGHCTEQHRVAYDIETVPYRSDDPNNRSFLVRCLGLARSADEAICIPFMSDPSQYRMGSGLIPHDGNAAGSFTSHYTEDDEYEILRAIDWLLNNPRIRKTAQNSPFDSYRLARQFGIFVRGLDLDTMYAWHCLYPELPKGLDFLCSVLTPFPYYSDYNNAVDREVWVYNGYDCVSTWLSAERIEVELKEQGLWEVYQNHVLPTMFSATRTEHRGVAIDPGRKKQMMEKTEQEVEEVRQKICQITGNKDFNPRSPPQLNQFLYGALGLPTQYARKRNADGTRSVTSDQHARDQLAKRFPEHALTLALVDEFSTKKTLITGFFNRPVRENGKMYTHLHTAGAVTRRSTSSDPGDEPGTNLQNVPIRKTPEFRDIFVANAPGESGWGLIKADLSAAEYMHVMWRTPVMRVVEKFVHEPNFDPHRWIAAQMYKIPEESIGKKSEYRMKGKNGNYGGSYGMQPDKAAITWKVMVAVAKDIMTRWHALMPEIEGMYWPKIMNMILTDRTIISPSGLRRTFYDRIEKDLSPLQAIFRDAYSHDAQSHVADLINRAWHLTDECFPEEECHPILMIHDELLFRYRLGLENKYCPLVKQFMEYPVMYEGVPYPLTIPAEVSYGPTWMQQTVWKEVA